MLLRFKIAALCIVLFLALSLQTVLAYAPNSASTSASTIKIQKMTASPNPTGLNFGFWEVYDKQNYTLEYFGKRSTSRVDFHSWANIENDPKHPGAYNFTNRFDNYARAHNYGETIFGAVNISFAKKTIPAFYPQDITNPKTRQAAKNFLYAYVQAALKQVGALTLTIDYEIMSNWGLSSPGSESKAAKWGDWYMEAAVVARKAASDIGMSDKLKLMPIVNGNPFAEGNPIFKGPSHNKWLVNAVKASDYLALDTYHSDPDYPNYDPKRTFDIIQFWITNFADSKDVIVTENGFNTIAQNNPGITREDRSMKTTGTEAEQAIYYKMLFEKLNEANQCNGIFNNKLRSFNIWSVRDNTHKRQGDEDRYFGLIGIDAAGKDYAKDAVQVVQNGLAKFESDSFHKPYNIFYGSDYTSSLLRGGASIPLTYSSGDEFEFLRYTDTSLPASETYNLLIDTRNDGNVIVKVNDKWLYAEGGNSFNFDIKHYIKTGASNTIDIYCTSSRFPFVQTVKRVMISSNEASK